MMRILKQSFKRDHFFRRLRTAPRRVLLLDYDGTLAPFRVERDRAMPYPGVVELLEEIEEFPRTRVVIISGRAIEDLKPLLAMRRTPELWGCHGWERQHADGRYEVMPIPASVASAFDAAARWVSTKAWDRHFERKPTSVALHWRGLDLDTSHAIRTAAEREWGRIARGAGLALHDFDGGVEVRMPGRNKGDAVRTILSDSPPDAAVAYLGDDLTDEDAFRALEGRGLSVLVRPDHRPTAADVWLVPPDELLAFLREWIESCRSAETHAAEKKVTT
jgi:trehalose 6-phosphate phosphatase